MAFNPTDEQRQAIEAEGNILVAAAAGSGKTAVLVERVVKKLTDKISPVSADRLLIVTFTNAAAAEMRSRIEKRLDDECRANPKDIGLRCQRQLLGSAKICTIDSFCIDLVRENFEKAGVMPDFKISDGYSLRPIDESILSGVISEYLEKNDSVFLKLLDTVGAEYDDSNFLKLVLDIYDYSRQLPFPDKWFDSLAEIYNMNFSDTEWYRYAFKKAVSTARRMVTELNNACDLFSGDEKAVEKFLPFFAELKNSAQYLLETAETGDWDEFYNVLENLIIPNMPRANGFSGSDIAASAKTVYAFIKKDIETLKRFFYNDYSFVSSQLESLSEQVELLSEILKIFSQRLFAEYLNRNTFTFHNTEHMALKLLYSPETGELTSEAEEFLKRFDEVMVDEYQDTNDLQDMLFYVLSGREKRLFVVGDVKQSIYGFRGANPENFLRKKNRYVDIAYAEENEPKKIILGKNFRCRREVCDYINYFFENMMTADSGSVVYDNSERLIPAAVFPQSDSPAVTFAVVECGGDSEERLRAEARCIAGYIKKVIASGKCIKDTENTLRKAVYADFAILLRSTKNKAAILADELRKHNIPVNFSIEEFAETVEISTFLALLKVIDNHNSDIELLTVMMSPIFGFSADEMADIRISKRNGSLYSAVVYAAASENVRCAELLHSIEKYRLYAVTVPLTRLITKLFAETDYLNTVSAMRDGSRRRNNLLLLETYANQYESENGGNIGGFVHYILKQSENGMKSAAVTSGGDTVRIMSIHASKGLQFPVCIIADTNSDFNDNDSRRSALFSSRFGMGFRYYDEELKTKCTTIGREVIIDAVRRSSMEEELRLLYVAMTRTQDMLLFTASSGNTEKLISGCRSTIAVSGNDSATEAFVRSKSYAKWLLSSALLHPDGKELRGAASNIIPLKTESHIKLLIAEDVKEESSSKETISESYYTDNELVEVILNNIAFEYPFEELISVEAKSSVSAIANKAESAKYAFSSRPAFMSNGGITPAERGTAMHKVMEFFDFTKSEDIESEIERLYEWQYITEREKDAVNRIALKAFFESDIFARIKRSPLVKREMRFLTEMSAIQVDSSLPERFSDENIIVQGAVDLCFEEDGKIIVLDFKTDRVDSSDDLITAYGEQLRIYSVACEKIFGKKVEQKLIYSFSLSKEIEVK